MRNLLEHRGYHGSVEPDLEEGDLRGKVLHTRDTLIYRGATIDDLRKAFVETVDWYLALCAEKGKKPDKPATGSVVIRIGEETHRAAMLAATDDGVSLNQWIGDAVNKALSDKGIKPDSGASPVLTAKNGGWRAKARGKKSTVLGGSKVGRRKKAPERA